MYQKFVNSAILFILVMFTACSKSDEPVVLPQEEIIMYNVDAEILPDKKNSALPSRSNTFGYVSGVGQYKAGDTCTLVARLTNGMMYIDHWRDGTRGAVKKFIVTQDTFFYAYAKPIECDDDDDD